MVNISTGDPISNEDLTASIPILESMVEYLTAISRPSYSLMLNDLRQDLYTLQGYATAREEHKEAAIQEGGGWRWRITPAR
jgi:hypothetical protein